MYDSSTCCKLCFRDIEKPQDRYLVEKIRKQINMIGETREQAFGIRYADGTYCNIKLTRPPSAPQAISDDVVDGESLDVLP